MKINSLEYVCSNIDQNPPNRITRWFKLCTIPLVNQPGDDTGERKQCSFIRETYSLDEKLS